MTLPPKRRKRRNGPEAETGDAYRNAGGNSVLIRAPNRAKAKRSDADDRIGERYPADSGDRRSDCAGGRFLQSKTALAHRLQDTIAGQQTIGYVDESEPGRKRSIDISAENGKTVIALISARAAKDALPPTSQNAVPPETAMPAKDAIPIHN